MGFQPAGNTIHKSYESTTIYNEELSLKFQFTHQNIVYQYKTWTDMNSQLNSLRQWLTSPINGVSRAIL